MDGKRFWILIAATIMLGSTVELIKHFGSSLTEQSDEPGFAYVDPTETEDAPHPKPGRNPKRNLYVAQFEMNPASQQKAPTHAHSDIAKPANMGKPTGDKPAEAEKKDKKKAKKKKDKKKSEAQAKNQPQPPEDAHKSKSSPVGGNTSSEPQTRFVPGGFAPATKLSKNAEEWVKYIKENQTFDSIAQLIEEYQLKRITPGVFFEILGKLKEDGSPQLRELAVRGYAPVYHYSSFIGLVEVYRLEPNSDLGQLAIRFLSQYAAPEQAKTLSAIASQNSDPDAAIIAIKMVHTAARNTLQKARNLSPSIASTPRLQELARRKVEGFYELLLKLSQNSPDSQIRAHAYQELALLNRIREQASALPTTPR